MAWMWSGIEIHQIDGANSVCRAPKRCLLLDEQGPLRSGARHPTESGSRYMYI